MHLPTRTPTSLDDVLRSIEDLAERLETVAPRPPGRATDKPRSWLKAAIKDGQIHLTVDCSTEISEFIANRWRLLTEAEGLEKIEDRSYLLESFDPIEELDQYLSPFWAHYDDLHFAQVAVSEWVDRKPWRAYADEYRDVPRRVSSADIFLADIETWARREEPTNVARLRKAGEAALRLDVRAMRKVLAPMLAQDAEQVERESGEGRGDLKMDETEPAAGAVLDQEPVQQHEANQRPAGPKGAREGDRRFCRRAQGKESGTSAFRGFSQAGQREELTKSLIRGPRLGRALGVVTPSSPIAAERRSHPRCTLPWGQKKNGVSDGKPRP